VKFARARVTFFILGSSENSIQLRKRLLELANEKIAKKLMAYKIGMLPNEISLTEQYYLASKSASGTFQVDCRQLIILFRPREASARFPV
jgi:hypothetical protein